MPFKVNGDQGEKNLFEMAPDESHDLDGENNVGEITGKWKYFLCMCVLGISQSLAERRSVGGQCLLWDVLVLDSTPFQNSCLIDILKWSLQTSSN